MKKMLITVTMMLLLTVGLCAAAQAAGNTTYNTATQVTFDQQYTESGIAEDANGKTNRWFKIGLPSSGQLSIRADVVREDSAVWLTLYDANLDQITQFTYSFNSITHEALQTDSYYLKAGTYYARFTPSGDSGIFFGSGAIKSLSVTFSFKSSSETIPESQSNSNDTYGTASQVALNQEYTGQISQFEDRVDRYTFRLDSAESIKVVCKAFMKKIKITIKDDQGSQKWSATPEWNSFVGYSDHTGKSIALAAGTYYLDFESVKLGYDSYSSGIYSFTLSGQNHEYHEVVTLPTLTADGQIQYVCECGDVQSTTVIPHPAQIDLNETSFTFNGKKITPAVIVRDAGGKDIDGENYTVTYAEGRKFPGTYQVTITFKGMYESCGSVERSFTIEQKGTSIKNVKAGKKQFTVKWKKTAAVSGYQIQYSTTSDFRNAETINAKKKATSLTIKKLKKGQTYYIRIRTAVRGKGTTYYSAWSGIKKVKVR